MAKKSTTTKPAATQHTDAVQTPAGSIPVPPLAAMPANPYMPRHIDLHVSAAQATALKQLTFALQAQGVNAKTGQDAVRYLLDRLSEVYDTSATA